MGVKNLLIMLNNLLQMYLKLLQKKAIQITAEATGNFIGNKIANELAKNSLQNNYETDSQMQEKSIEIPKKVHMSPEKDSKLLII